MLTCYTCDEPINPDEVVEIDDQSFHAECLRDNGMIQCPNCGEWFDTKK